MGIPAPISKAVDQMKAAAQLPALPNGLPDASSVFPTNIADGLASIFSATVSGSAAGQSSAQITSVIALINSPPGSPSGGISAGDALILEGALSPFEDIFAPMTEATLQSTNMSVHTGNLQANLPNVLKQATTSNALRSGIEFSKPKCNTGETISNNIFPTTTPISNGNATSEVAGTLSDDGDKLQNDASDKTDILIAAISTSQVTTYPVDDLTNRLDTQLDLIETYVNASEPPATWVNDVKTALNLIRDNHKILPVSGGGDGILLDLGNDVNAAGALIETTYLKERANVGMPNLDGSALTDPTTGVTIPAGDANSMQIGEGNITAEIKQNAFALQAHTITNNPCAQNIVGRGGTNEMGASATSSLPQSPDTNITLTVDRVKSAEEIKAEADLDLDEAADEALIQADVGTRIDQVTWASPVYKFRPGVYSSRVGMNFRLIINIPDSVTQTPNTIPGVYELDYYMTEVETETSFFGAEKISRSVQGAVHRFIIGAWISDMRSRYGKLNGDPLRLDKDVGIDIFSYSSGANDHNLAFIGAPDLEFSVHGEIFDQGGVDCTSAGDGFCQLSINDLVIGDLTLIGPVDDNDIKYHIKSAIVDTQVQVKHWMENDSPKGMKDAFEKYFCENTGGSPC